VWEEIREMRSSSTNHRTRVFSGVQPSGKLHIGNYLGAIRRWVEKQSEKENFFCIVDMHAITTPQDPETLRRMSRDVAAVYVASGLDPEFSTIFIQSHVPEHAECCWILNCITPLGWLERMTQFKIKSEQRESVSTGLLDYPVLQAADILLYDTHEVPIGEDQKQHVELARDIAQRFNFLYGDTFVIPEPVIPTSGARIRALNDPTRKMSKSESEARGHAIFITDSEDEVRHAIRTAVTDSGKEIVFSEAPEKAGVNNLLEIYELLTGKSRAAIESHFAGKGYGVLKNDVAEIVIESLRPIRERYLNLMAEPRELDSILDRGAQHARSVAGLKMQEVKQKIGFIPRL
jgi:tryptophanyl-tRNA synthetase